jgi:hypothetical protein
LLVLGGAFDGRTVKGRVLSYEAPFGIGYLVAEVSVDETPGRQREAVSATQARAPRGLRRLFDR